MYTSKVEIYELIKAWLAISVAFTILLRATDIGIINVFILSIITVGAGFLLHELAHKIVAQYYHCHAEFKADNQMLIIAIIMSFIGFIIAAPGAVRIKGFTTYRENGIISIAGPITNAILAFIFLPFIFFGGLIGIVASYGFLINSWLGLFNMIPVWKFDGAKVWEWNKTIYWITTITLLIMTFSSFYLI